MPKSLPWFFALALGFGLAASPAEAAVHRDLDALDLKEASQDLTKGGPAIKALFSPSGVGYLVGGGGVDYLSEHFYLGGAGYGGSVAGGGLGYGGMVTGYENKLGDNNAYNVSLLVGGGGGSSGGSLVLEPEVSVSQLFGGGVRGTLSAGYLYMPNAGATSGATVGLRLEFKNLTVTLPIDE